jgi:glycosyltransferase involved in cell wall biosynthesis
MKIVFIVQQLSQPRCIKRIKAIYDAGFKVKVYGFDSGLYNDTLKSLPFPVERIIKRDKSKKKLTKLKEFRICLKQILKENSNNDLYYLFGFEIASMAWLLGYKNYIYEEADVTAARVSNPFIRNLLLSIDRVVIKKSYRTVLTSEGFIKCIFPTNKPVNKLIMMPNKLSPYFDAYKKAQVKSLPIDFNHIKFGFIGLIRYPNTIVRFARVIGKFFPNHEFHFWGDTEYDEYLDNEIKSFSNVYIHGRFKNPDDLLKIYTNTDISVVCYDTSSGNVLIAEPNKIYESIFFETPIVVSSGTYLAERVKQFNAGFDIKADNDDSIRVFVNSIKESILMKIITSIREIPWQETVEDASYLIDSIKNYCYDGKEKSN